MGIARHSGNSGASWALWLTIFYNSFPAFSVLKENKDKGLVEAQQFELSEYTSERGFLKALFREQ